MSAKRPLALVTGAATRIGAACAEHLAQQGYDLLLHVHTSDWQSTSHACSQQGAKVTPIIADLSSAQGIEALSKAAVAQDQLDVVVNSAAVYPDAEFGSLTCQELRSTFSINLFAPLLIVQNVSLAPGALVVNFVDSRVAQSRQPRLGYSLTKSALAQATKQLAHMLAPNVRVNAICPGPVLAPPVISDAAQAQAYIQTKTATTLLQRQVAVADLIHALQYLLHAPSVTGQLLFVDSGQHLQ